MASGLGAFDALAMLLSTGNLTKSGLSPTAGLKTRGTPPKGSAVRVHFPTTPGLSATVLPSLYVSKDDSTYKLQSVYPGGALSWASGGNEVMLDYHHSQEYPYVKIYFTITGGSTACSYGAVKAGIVPRTHGDFTRVPRFD
jgi:hypothetical protein